MSDPRTQYDKREEFYGTDEYSLVFGRTEVENYIL